MVRCAHLYALWWTYDQDPVLHHTGEKAQAEFALYGCQHGDYSGIATLEDIVRRGRMTP